MTPRPGRPARRVFLALGAGLGTALTFVLALVAAVVIHLGIPATRRVAAVRVSSLLGTILEGDIAIERVGRLGLDGVDGVRARVRDPEGVSVLFVDGASVRVATLDLLRSLLSGKGPLRIDLRSVRIAHADVALDAGPDGELRLARAFAPKEEKPPPPKEPGRGVQIDARAIALRHAWIHGTPPGAPPIDADVGDLVAKGHYDPKTIRAVLDHVALAVRGAPRGLDPKGTLRGSYGDGAKRSVEAVYDGVIAGMPTTLEAKMDGKRVDARLDVHDASGRNVAALVGELPIRERVELHAEAHGDLPRVEAGARLTLGAALADVRASITTGDDTAVDATLALRRFDVRAVAEDAPASDLALDARANVALDKDGVRGGFAANVLPSKVDDTDVPKIAIRGTFAKDAVDATARIDDPSMPTEIRITSAPAGKARSVDATVRTDIADIRRLPKVGNVAEGRVHAEATAHLMLPDKTVDGTVSVQASALAKGPLHVAELRAKADVHGTIDRPVIDAEAHAREIHVAKERLDRVDARAKIDKAPGALTVKDVLVEGLGEPIRAELFRDAQGIRAKIAAPRIDVARAAALAGKSGVSGGIGVAGDVVLRHGTADGEIHVRGAELATSQLAHGTLVVDAAVHGRTLDASARADLGQAGHLALAAQQLSLTGDLADPAAFGRATGHVALDGDVDLARAATLVPEQLLPVGEVRGRFVAQGSADRDVATAAPSVSMHVHTTGLVVAAKTPTEISNAGTRITAVAPWRSAGVDVGFDLATDTASGLGTVALRLTDRRGAIAALDGKTVVPFTELLGAPPDVRAKLLRAPLSAKVVVAKRPLSAFPSLLGIGDLPGDVEADLEVRGSVLDPRVDLVVHGRDVRLPGSRMKSPADADLVVSYDGAAANVSAKVRSDNAELLDASSRIEVKAADLVEARAGTEPAWRAGARVKLTNFPLESLPGASDRRIRGRVSGEAVLERLRDDASLKAALDLSGFRVGRAKYERGRVELTAGGGQLAAKARLEQSDGFADLNVISGLAWGAELAPKLDASRPLEAKLKAAAFRAAALEPFAGGAVDALDGRIDADALAKIDPTGQNTQLEGKVTLREGRAQIAAIGDELHDIRATVTLAQGGTIRVDDVFARASQGELSADALVVLSGLHLASAKANLRIPKKKAIDLAIQGESIGDVWGDVKVDATASADGKTTSVVVDVPSFNVELASLSRRDVQALEEKPKIRVGTYRDAQTFDRLPLDGEDLEPEKPVASEPTLLEVDVRLGNVIVERRNMLRIALEGNPKIAIGGETRITGQIRVKEGKVDVQGKQFTVEKGSLTFNGEVPPNPVLVASAGWSAQDGTRVYADFSGPVDGGKLELRSEPARPKNEILAMVLFGTSDGANAPPSTGKTDSTTQAAVGLGGAVAAQGLTEALDDLAGIHASARIDMTRASNPRPEVEFQLTQRVSIEFAHVLGTPPLSEPDKNLGTIDWRFRANWSLETTIGDRGTTIVDAIWLKRY